MKKYLLLSFLFMFGCCKNISVYSKNEPKITLQDFYSQNLIARGVIFDFFGRAKSRIIMTSKPSKVEDFVDPLQPNLKLKKMYLQQSMTYLEEGKKEEFVSYAIYDENGQIFRYKDNMMLAESSYKTSGNTANVKYDLKVEREKDKYINLAADDWLYLVDDTTAINRIDLRKFGILVSHIVMTIQKQK